MEPARFLIVIPTFNERENIVQLIDRILELYAQADVFVVDDSSKDGTADAVREAQKRYGDRLQLLVRSGKNGRGSAVLEGLKKAQEGSYTYAMEMDADFSHRPEEIALFLPLMERYDCVIGSRYLPGSEIREWGWKRTIFSRWANRYARCILRMPLSDYTNGFRCYTRKALAAIEPSKIDAKGYVVLSEVAYQLHKKGIQFGEVPTLFVNRRRGTSNLGFHEINEALFSVLRIRWPRLSGIIQNLGTFALRGLLSAVIDLGLLALLVRFTSMGVGWAFVLSSCIAIAAMFELRRKYWGGSATIPPHTFFLLYGAVGLLAVLVAIVFHHHLGFPPVWSKFFGIVIASPISYWGARRLLPR